MDKKDIVILKHAASETDTAETEIQQLSEKSKSQQVRLQQLRDELGKINQKTGQSTKTVQSTTSRKRENHVNVFRAPLTYEELYAQASASLRAKGLDPDDIGYQDLVSEDELEKIVTELNSALPREETWSKADFIVTFVAAFVGCCADLLLSNRDNPLTGTKSAFSEKLNNLHEKVFKHKTGAPIDYQGPHFGGGFHRELSKGHDLARFVEGIKSFKNGTFEAIRYENGVRMVVQATSNQFGTPFGQLTTIQAIIEYAHHMFADLFSTYSLPFPGYSFLTESSSRNLRKFAATMYQNGFNCKNVITQSLTTIIIEVIIRLYYSIQAVRGMKEEIELEEDYSNFDAFKEFISPHKTDKLNEMLLVAHSIVTGFNTGKIVIKCLATKNIKSVSELNITEIMATVRYGISVMKATLKRNNSFSKLIYHSDEITKQWNEIEKEYELEESLVVRTYEEVVEI